MRTARLVGLSADGRFLIVATDSGEELAVPADDRLRAALRGDRPRLGQLEIEMDSALTPREIQGRIRAGASVEDVARVAGIPADRVERFAAPVLAERAHIARLAMASTVRRRGETSAHRTLQATLTERLLARGVDLGTLDWDAHRLGDGRWAVVAAYRSGEAARKAEFWFDITGRFSVGGNDDARWVLGEQSPAKGPQPGRRRPEGQPGDDADTEPTLDLSDELALVRVVQDDPAARTPNTPAGVDDRPLATVQALRPAEPAETTPAEATPAETTPAEATPPGPEAAEPAPAPLDTLHGMLDGDGLPENETRQYRGLSDAAAVPDIVSGGWEPAVVVGYPIEPADDPEGTDVPGPPEQIVSGQDRRDEAAALAQEHEGARLEPAVRQSEPEPTPESEAGAAGPPEEPVARPGKRKRAAVPSWDEILFGGPKRPS